VYLHNAKNADNDGWFIKIMMVVPTSLSDYQTLLHENLHPKSIGAQEFKQVGHTDSANP